MNIRETCLIHTDLKSDQVAILQKMVDHLDFLKIYFQRILVVAWGKQSEVVIISSQARSRVISREDLADVIAGCGPNAKQVPISLANEADVGMVVYGEKMATSPESLLGLIDFCQSSADACCPAAYLLPDGIIIFDREGRLKFKNSIAQTMLRRLKLQDISLAGLAASLGVSPDQFLPSNQSVFLGDAFQVGLFDICVIVNPIMIQEEYLGALVVISDLTLIRKKEKELMEKSTVIKEIHHRVKNNLQTITSLLRLQMRRSNLKIVEKVFTESINRVLSIALIHEALSKQEFEVVNIKQTSYNILQMILSNMVDPNKKISGDIYGADVYLSATLASSVSLCVTELIQNSVEHAFINREEGSIRISVEQPNHEVVIKIEDNGVGVTAAKLQNESSLGMEIVNTIIKHNLKGSFSIEGHRYGTVAIIKFPKTNMEGVEV